MRKQLVLKPNVPALGLVQRPSCKSFSAKHGLGKLSLHGIFAVLGVKRRRGGQDLTPRCHHGGLWAGLGWLGALRVLLLAPAAPVPQLSVCQETLALPTAGFGLCTRGVHAQNPQIALWTPHSRADPQCYQGEGMQTGL